MVDQYVVIGNPTAQNKSSLIHASFTEQTGEGLVYGKIEGTLGEFERTVLAIRVAGGCGMNVTTPCKHGAEQFATRCAKSVQLIGAVNTLKLSGT